MSFKTDEVINIAGSVAVRKVHFNSEGLEMLNDIRRFLEDRTYDRTGEQVTISVPAAIHLMMQEYIELLEQNGHVVRDPVITV